MKQKSQGYSIGTAYLIFYNVFQTLGWSILLVQTLHHLAFHGFNTSGLWAETQSVLKIFQTLALLEVGHCIVRLVPSSAVVTACQVFSRVIVLWFVCHTVPEAQQSIGYMLLLLAWSFTEVVRYSYYFLNLLQSLPSLLTYLRYTLFIVLYPTGVIGEMFCHYAALPAFQRGRMYSIDMPNRVNMAFDSYYGLVLIMFLYLPIFPQMYLHMFVQRRKVLGKARPKTE